MCLCSYGECIAKDGRRVYSLLELANSDKALKNEQFLSANELHCQLQLRVSELEAWTANYSLLLEQRHFAYFF